MEKIAKLIAEHTKLHKTYDSIGNDVDATQALLLHAIITKKLTDSGIEHNSPLEKTPIKKFAWMTLPKPSMEWFAVDEDTVTKFWKECVEPIIEDYGKAVAELSWGGDRVVIEKYGSNIAMYTNNTYMNIIDNFKDLKRELLLMSEDVILDCTISKYSDFCTVNDILFCNGSLMASSAIARKDVINELMKKYMFGGITMSNYFVIESKVQFIDMLCYGGHIATVKGNGKYPENFYADSWVKIHTSVLFDLEVADMSENDGIFKYELGYDRDDETKVTFVTYDTNIPVEKGDVLRVFSDRIDINKNKDGVLEIKPSTVLVSKKVYSKAMNIEDIADAAIEGGILASNDMEFFKKAKAKRDKDENERITKPYDGEHSARINEPSKYVKFRRVNDKFGKGIDVIYGIKENKKSEVQSIRFDKKKFTVTEAKKWLKEHNYKYIKFEPAKVKKNAEDVSFIKIIKTDEKKRIVYGVVLQPGVRDAQDHIISAETIEKACYDYMERGYKITVQHGDEDYTDEIPVIENYITPQAVTIGHEKVKKGAWVMAVKINNEEIWERVEKKELTGFSIEGIGCLSEA